MHAETNDQAQHLCKNCGHAFAGKYCNICGEQVYTAHDKSVMHIGEEALHFITHFEGNFLTSVKTIFLKPGKLSLDYCNGIRKKYYKPVTMFFFLIVIYLFFPKIFPKGLDMELHYYRGFGPFSSHASRAIEAKMQHLNISFDQLEELFAHESHVVSKFMLFIVLPLCAFVLMALYPTRKGKVFFDHFMLSTEVNAFFLTAFFMLFPIAMAIIGLIAQLVALLVFHYDLNPVLFRSELPVLIIQAILFTIFCTVAFKRFYGSSTIVSAIKAFLFVLLQGIIVYGLYKVLLFMAVMALL